MHATCAGHEHSACGGVNMRSASSAFSIASRGEVQQRINTWVRKFNTTGWLSIAFSRRLLKPNTVSSPTQHLNSVSTHISCSPVPRVHAMQGNKHEHVKHMMHPINASSNTPPKTQWLEPAALGENALLNTHSSLATRDHNSSL